MINVSLPQLTDKNWYITRCENSPKYMFGIENEPFYSGSYTQCLIVLGSVMTGSSIEFATNLANQIEIR